MIGEGKYHNPRHGMYVYSSNNSIPSFKGGFRKQVSHSHVFVSFSWEGKLDGTPSSIFFMCCIFCGTPECGRSTGKRERKREKERERERKRAHGHLSGRTRRVSCTPTQPARCLYHDSLGPGSLCKKTLRAAEATRRKAEILPTCMLPTSQTPLRASGGQRKQLNYELHQREQSISHTRPRPRPRQAQIISQTVTKVTRRQQPVHPLVQTKS